MPNLCETIRERLKVGGIFTLQCVGDSVTQGTNHCRPEETYTAKLASCFAEKFGDACVMRYDGRVVNELAPLDGFDGPILVRFGEKGRINVIRNGVGGNTVARLMNRADDFTGEVAGFRPDITTVMCGINDALAEEPKKYVTDAVFKENYRRLIGMIQKENPDTEIVLLTPSYNDSGDKTESRLDPYCARVHELAKEYGLDLIDVHALWMNHLEVGGEHYGQGDWLSDCKGDMCHPSPKGAEMTARFIFEEFMKL